MSTVNVRNLPDAVHRALRVRAAQHGRSTESEIRFILEEATRPTERMEQARAMELAAGIPSVPHKPTPEPPHHEPTQESPEC
jgi:plasmid stability protein